MYTVYADDVLIHDPISPDRRIHLTSPTLKMQENAAGTFECSVIPDSVGYNSFVRMKTVVSIRKDNHTIWTGRPIKETTDFYGCKKITCEGALAYLNDTIQDPMEYMNANVRSVFQSLIAAHNSKVGANDKRRFAIGSLTIQDFDDSYIFETNYNSTWTTIKTNYIDRLGGHLGIKYVGTGTLPYIYYDMEYTTSTQEINFGENLLNFTRNYDLSDLFTVIFPKGKEISADSTSSDAEDDANPISSSSVTSTNSVTLRYTVITSDLRVTAKITSISVTSSVAYKGAHTFTLVVGDETIVSKKATYTTTTNNGKTYKHYQSAKACADAAVNTVTTKISNDNAKVTFDRKTKASSENLVLNVFGKAVTIKISIPARDDTSSHLTESTKKEYTTVASVNNGSVYVENATAVANFGRIERVIEFNDIDSPKMLLALAKTYLKALQFGEMCLEVSALDLHNIDPAITGFELLDQVRCVSNMHGMDKMFPITEVSIPLDNPDKETYMLGKSASATMTSKTISNATSFYGALQAIPSFKNTLDVAKRDMSVLLNRRTNGYVNIVQENDISQALVISDTPDWLNADKLWKFDINGLGYSDSLAADEDPNYDGPSTIADGRWYKMGMTMDGTIVADVIKTGILEDGLGYNYWNLSTGEFSLQPNTVVLGDGETTLADVQTASTNAASLATSAASQASSAQTKATAAQNTANQANENFNLVKGKQYGVANLLNGTYNLTIPKTGGGSWSASTWKHVGNGNGKIQILNCTKAVVGIAPINSWIKKSVKIQGSSNGGSRGLAQYGVELEYSTTYCMSCYVFGTGRLRMQVGAADKASGEERYITKYINVSNKKKWVRYSLVFTTNDSTNDKGNKYAGISSSSTVKVYFMNAGSSSSAYLHISALKIERGNTPTDWFPSVEDINKNAQEYTRAFVEENIPKATAKQLKQYDDMLTYEKVVAKLTSGNKHDGIYSKKVDGKMAVLINASYIQSGSLNANIIKTGWIRDKNLKNEWNLKTGYFKTNQMHATNIVATGMFTSGTKKTQAMQMDAGCIHGYDSGKLVSTIETTSSTYDVSNGRSYSGLCLRGKQIIEFRSPKTAVRTRNDNGVSYITHTGTFNFDTVEEIRDMGYGSISWTTVTHSIKILNGLIVAIG